MATLIAWHADVNASNEDGDTALILACNRGHVEVARMLLAARRRARIWRTTASINGHVNVVRALLATGAHVDATNDGGCTALICASNHGHVEVVRALLAAGAGVDAAKNDGWTALICASCDGHVETVRALLAAGANKHLINNSGGTAYSLATSISFSTAAIRALLALAP